MRQVFLAPVAVRARRFFIRILARLGFREEAYLVVFACVIGALTGAGSVVFTRLIHLAHEGCYGFDGHAGLYGGRWWFLILLPAVGALLVGCITYFFAREAKGHGVPEVMDAIARHDGKIRPRVAIAKAVASALTIGSGGSAGTEGPIIQIGAASGSSMGQVFRVAPYNLTVLVGCGAAAGISAIFHAPVAGVLFALEIFLRELNFRSFSPVLLASVISSVTVRALLGSKEAIFPLVRPDTVYSFSWYELGNYIVLGLLCAVAAVAFVRLLYATEDFFDRLPVHHIAKPVIGGALLGGLGLLTAAPVMKMFVGEPAVFGNGYRLIGECIGAGAAAGSVQELTIMLLLVLLLLKTLATCLTLGSGGSGGIFAPSLFLGAVVGYAFGLALQSLGVFAGVHPETYALVGMASVVAATTHAPMTAIVILFEMTQNYQVILPVMFSATIALTIARFLFRDSIYTLKLHRRGVHYASRGNTAVLRRLTVGMVMQGECAVVPEDMPLGRVLKEVYEKDFTDLIVTDSRGHYLGLLVGADLRAVMMEPAAVPLLVAGELTRRKVPTVSPHETLDKVFDKFALFDDVDNLAVHSEDNNDHFIGMISRAALMRRYHQELQQSD